MLQDGAKKRYIEERVNLPTGKSSAEIARDIPAGIRAQSFFSARVSEAHILERFRNITDDYVSGRIGRDEARNLMLEYARENGRDDGTRGLKNLASSARLNLILDQNAKMAKAVGDYDRMYSGSSREAFPYVIYHASVGSREPRAEHKKYDGMIFSKDDPWLKSHWPPWEFGCNCELENCSAKKAGKTQDRIQPQSPPEVATNVYSGSGYSFDPSHAFETFDLSSVKDAQARFNIREDAEINFGSQVEFNQTATQAKVTAEQNFKTFKEEGLPSSAEWKNKELPMTPEEVKPGDARKQLEKGIQTKTADGDDVIFGKTILEHWEIEKGKETSDIDGRLKKLNMALATVANPIEIWDQGIQKAYIQAFKKLTGGYSGCLVFVLKDGTAKTYFLKDLNALNKARKGIAVKSF